MAFFTLFARFSLAGGPVGRGLEGIVSAAATPPLGHDDTISGIHQISDHMPPLGIADDGSRRDVDQHVVGTAALTVTPLPGATGMGPPVLVAGQGGETVDIGGGHHNHVAPAPTVSAAGPPLVDLVLPSEADAAVAAVSPLDVDGDAIEKHAGTGRPVERRNESERIGRGRPADKTEPADGGVPDSPRGRNGRNLRPPRNPLFPSVLRPTQSADKIGALKSRR